MDPRIAFAQAAATEGRHAAAAEALVALLAEDPQQDAAAYTTLARALYLTGQYQTGVLWSADGVARHPQDAGLWNLHGVMLRVLRRPQEALAALERAVAIDPNHVGAPANRAAVLLDLGRDEAARAAFETLAERDPSQPSHPMNLGRALARLGRAQDAEIAFRAALALKPDYADAWRQLAVLRRGLGDMAGAEAVLDEALAAAPDSENLMEAKVLFLREQDLKTRAIAFLTSVLPRFDHSASAHMHLGDLLSDHDRAGANRELRRALELEPSADHLALLIQSLGRTFGAEEGAALDEAQALCERLVAGGPLSPGQSSIAAEVQLRLCDFAGFERLGGFADLGRRWAESGRHAALFRLIGRVRSDADRLELVEQHRIWRRAQQANADAAPIRRPPPRPIDGRIRLGFMSADLRRHPVGYFALPLFDHVDRDRFDLYAYSFFRGEEDALQRRFAERCAFRWTPEITARAAAQMIADDQLDMLIELGGSTQMNKLDVMAWKPAPRQASWLGYPHSAGLDTIDDFICDPFNRPTDPRLMLEAPLLMPQSWIGLGAAVFNDDHAIDPAIPQDRHGGALTFGTANNTHKYTAEALRAWARITAAVPGARFAFLRPEGASLAFRRNVLAHFAAEGVEAERVLFYAVRGAHMPVYNMIDITLDTFPLTGGTTTVEALWMGVPVVSLKGPAFYERLSWSILANAGLADLAADDLEGFTRNALDLAADRNRRVRLRTELRPLLKQSPLGRAEDFARDFYDMIARAIRPA